MSFVITISRTYGSGGKEIGRLVAKKLGVSYFGRDVLNNGNADILTDDETIRFSKSITDSNLDFEEADKNFKRQSATILDLASRESCVIVGRCSDYVLKDIDNVLKVFIHASPRHCMRRVMRLYELNPDDAKEIIRTMNKNRSEYYSYHTGQNRDSALNYDLCLNVTGMDVNDAADEIIGFLNRHIK